MRRAAGALARGLRERSGALRATRVVATSAPADAAAAAAAAPAAAPAPGVKPPNLQEFKVYRWSPDVPGQKPYLKSYTARRAAVRAARGLAAPAASRTRTQRLVAPRAPRGAGGVPGAPAAAKSERNDPGLAFW
jgi:hypothetical protein